ncbi:glycosyl transferase family 41-domain-containing protein [Vararia minispora EC-137]|uniref:Glycosyl transferase family 41-domain-containing protein n=1 Tax=Vararia minispora EC-137 TaxID=1314806 RepID=A0ACB8QMS6_9AGAM|nr:glycosyl transferase family 41-domain-containing protein [Vararia minispora EC-137]
MSTPASVLVRIFHLDYVILLRSLTIIGHGGFSILDTPARLEVAPTRTPTAGGIAPFSSSPFTEDTPQDVSLSPNVPYLDVSVRDTLLQHAYRMYENSSSFVPPGLTYMPLPTIAMSTPQVNKVYSEQLLPLLIVLNSLYQQHPPTLLLLGSVYFALGNYQSALQTFGEILAVEPNYVEAMFNVGCTLQALGELADARNHWQQALQHDPIYWEAMDNLLGSFLTSDLTSTPHDNVHVYRHVYSLCRQILSRIVDPIGRMIVPIIPSHLFRLQKLYYTSGTVLRLSSTAESQPPLLQDYLAAIELAIQFSAPSGDVLRFTFRDLVAAVSFSCLLMAHGRNTVIPQRVLDSLSTPDRVYTSAMVVEPGFDVLEAVHLAGDDILSTLHGGTGFFPITLLLPEQAVNLAHALFPRSAGVLPGICVFDTDSSQVRVPPEGLQQDTNFMTSTVLLTLANRVQELVSGTPILPPSTRLNILAGPSLALLLYYLSLSLSPTPSTYNDLGVIIASLPNWRTYIAPSGEQQTLTGHRLARAYYDYGLQMNSTHPYLLMNSGSLLKDEDHIADAIRLYQAALHYKPDFDIALANLGNAVKDIGRPWEAIQYFERAIVLNPRLPEAVCGLASSKTALCDWRGRGAIKDEIGVDDDGHLIPAFASPDAIAGWLHTVFEITAMQLDASYVVNAGLVRALGDVDFWLKWVEKATDAPLSGENLARWRKLFMRFFSDFDRQGKKVNEGGFVIRFVEWSLRRMQKNWYKDLYGNVESTDTRCRPPSLDDVQRYTWLQFPHSSISAVVPCVLPFHTFAYPMPCRMIRLISHRNALRTSLSVLLQPWMPRHVYPPPAPPVRGRINVGYVSGDLNDHPLAHLMQSVFGLHDRDMFGIHVYAISASDGSYSRRKIESESEHFLDCSSWPTKAVIERIVRDQIHILVNLGGYTKGARNDIFAARPCPVQMSLMGFAGTLAAGWCDYLVCDSIACPKELAASERWRARKIAGFETSRMQDGFKELDLETDIDSVADPESLNEDWMYTEKLLYMPHSFMVTDHKQSSREDEHLTPGLRAQTPGSLLWAAEERRRLEWRLRCFPVLQPNTFIFANFNQLYKVRTAVFGSWLKILARLPNSILWLLRFPPSGEAHLLKTARLWAGEQIASRIVFSDVAPKEDHISRARVADLFLDTLECSAHTIAADILWSGTPMITCPRYKYKMCSRVSSSMAHATGLGNKMVVNSLQEYEERAVALARSLSYSQVEPHPGCFEWRSQGELAELRRALFLNRDHMPLFDTARWTQNLERGFREAWRRWARGTEFEVSSEWEATSRSEKVSGCIVVQDSTPVIFRTQ